jgi:hypothetical protein
VVRLGLNNLQEKALLTKEAETWTIGAKSRMKMKVVQERRLLALAAMKAAQAEEADAPDRIKIISRVKIRIYD